MAENESGGFATALRAAIMRSGLSLDRIQVRLRDRGVDISVATLSYWQSGRSEPGRRASVAALSDLEEILGLASGDLQAHLAVVSRTRRRSTPTLLSDLLDSDKAMSDQLLRADARFREMLNIVSEHCAITVDKTCRMSSRWVRRVMTAEVSGADRFLVMRVRQDPDGPEPTFAPRLHCEAGETFAAPGTGLLAQEVLLDRVLERGESIIVEYELAAPPSDMEYATARRTSIRELVLEVRFDPDALPTRCELVQSRLDGSEEIVGPIGLDSSHCVRMIRHNQPAGRYAVRWYRDET